MAQDNSLTLAALELSYVLSSLSSAPLAVLYERHLMAASFALSDLSEAEPADWKGGNYWEGESSTSSSSILD
jgi:hypothetical protein